MNYRVKYTSEEVAAAIERSVCKLQSLGVLNADTLYVVLLNGGVWFASHLFDCLGAVNNEVYYVKCHSYDGAERGRLVWDYVPDIQAEGRQVVVIDDICDSGQTATAVVRYIKNDLKAAGVTVFTLLSRTTTRLEEDVNLYSCIVDDSDDFLVGCGLDDNRSSRMLPYIGVIERNK